jgi:hypothetical protein
MKALELDDELGNELVAYTSELDADESLVDHLHDLLYVTSPEYKLGWAWNPAEESALATVRINGTECTFDPLTREIRER